MKVPSAVVQGDFNYLINPFHKDYSRIKIVSTERFSFDNRLFLK
jgi:RES domain-containing protein